MLPRKLRVAHARGKWSLRAARVSRHKQLRPVAAKHVFDAEGSGYTTWITAGGYKDRSLYALTSGSGPLDHPRPSVPGLVIGTVVDNMDEDGLGRVKVMFPWLAAGYVSAWARVMQIGASKVGGGFLWIPEVGNEVLLGFDRGSIDYPFVDNMLAAHGREPFTGDRKVLVAMAQPHVHPEYR